MRVTALIGLLGLVAGCASPAGRASEAAARACPIVWVADRGLDAVLVLDGCDGELLRIAAEGVPDPSAALPSADGGALVSSFHDGGLHRVGADGHRTVLLQDRRVIEEPVAMTADGSEVLVLARDTRRFVRVDPTDGRVLGSFGGSALEGAHDFVRRGDLLYVTTSWNGESEGRIQVWDPEAGALLGAFAPDLGLPVGIAAAPDGALWVADWIRDRVVRVEVDGVPAEAGRFERPTDVAFAPDGTLFVTAGAGLWRRDLDGTTVSLAGDLLEDPRAVVVVR